MIKHLIQKPAWTAFIVLVAIATGLFLFPGVSNAKRKKRRKQRKFKVSKVNAKFDYLPKLPAGKKFKLAWHDEFNGKKLDRTKWRIRKAGPRKGGYWMDETITLDGKGNLVIKTIKKDGKFAGGCITTAGKYMRKYGYYVARCKLQSQPGHWSAFWLNSPGVGKVGNGGRDGAEIDIMEKPWRDARVQHTLHWDGYGKDHKAKGFISKVPGVMKGFHTFSLLWTPDEYVFYVDGKETWRTKAGGVSQAPSYILLSEEVGKWGGDITKAKLPDRFTCDYVRVYDIVDTKNKN